MFRRVIMIAAIAALLPFSIFDHPVLAHHSNANYDQTKTVTLKGTVASWDWGNPHVVVAYDVKDDNGHVVRWTTELASVESELSDGLNKIRSSLATRSLPLSTQRRTVRRIPWLSKCSGATGPFCAALASAIRPAAPKPTNKTPGQ